MAERVQDTEINDVTAYIIGGVAILFMSFLQEILTLPLAFLLTNRLLVWGVIGPHS